MDHSRTESNIVRCVALSGPTGSGKTTLQRCLMDSHGVWTPRNYTTRSVGESDTATEFVEPTEFHAWVLNGDLVLPQIFANSWYAWNPTDLAALRTDVGFAVVNVRPYTALALGALLPDVHPVWLFQDDETLAARRSARGEARDIGHHREVRDLKDLDESDYGGVFVTRVRSDEYALRTLLNILGIQ